MSEVGYVYILTNPSFREDWVKIGKSSRPVDVRSKELDNTAVPLPFEIFATMQTSKYNEVERLVHKTIDRLTDLRIRQNREFFNVSPTKALDIFRDIAQTIDDAVITEYQGNIPVRQNVEKKVSKNKLKKERQYILDNTSYKSMTALVFAIAKKLMTEYPRINYVELKKILPLNASNGTETILSHNEYLMYMDAGQDKRKRTRYYKETLCDCNGEIIHISTQWTISYMRNSFIPEIRKRLGYDAIVR